MFQCIDNDDESCEHLMNWDGDSCADDDEDCHGTIDLDLADGYPEGFKAANEPEMRKVVPSVLTRSMSSSEHRTKNREFMIRCAERCLIGVIWKLRS